MSGTPAPERDGASRQRLAWIGLLLVAVVFAVDWIADVRQRDLFSWMDPYQYYHFARAVLDGRERFDSFEIPSIFPFFVMPLLAFRRSIPAALGIDLAALVLMLAGVHRLCRELEIRTPSPLVAVLVLCSPLLLGLSRTLYVEFTLTAIATMAFAAWLALLRDPGRRTATVFGLWLALGFLTKITFPVFLVAPVAAAVLQALATRRDRDAATFALASLAPLVLAVLLHASVFAPSAGYYLNLVRTSLPFMYLMGPPEPFSLASATYYFAEVGRSFLLLLTPFLALPLWAALRGRLSGASRQALWLWLLGPLVLLIVHPLKEPRHVAPCVVPAVLLLVLGIEALPRRALRLVATALALVLAGIQYLGVTLSWWQTPYFLDRPLHYAEIREQLRARGDAGIDRETPPGLRGLLRRYDRNVAIAGFPANEALALTWQGFPGVVFDLDTFEDPKRFFGRVAFTRFEDLYFLAAINTYNRRCGWRWYHPTLPRETVVANADFLIVNGGRPEELAARFPDHELVATIAREPGQIHVLRTRGPTIPYRTLYARRFLAQGSVSGPERRVVARELLMVAALAGDGAQARALLREFPILRAPGEVRNIYWISRYPALEHLADRRLSALLDAHGP